MKNRLSPYLLSLALLFLLSIAFLLPTKRAAATDDARESTGTVHLYAPLVVKPGSVPTPDPLAVSVTLDQSRVVTGTIPAEGGSLSLTAPDGKQFTLAIPASALLSPQEITMTLLSGVEGLPLSGGLRAGVHLEPEGLKLFKPATLTIAGAQPPATGLRSVGFGFQEMGSEFHLRPADASGTTHTLRLMHFSGYGLTAGTEAEIATQAAQHPPTNTESWFAQASARNSSEMSQYLQWWWNRNQHWFEQADSSELALLFSLTEMSMWHHAVAEAGLANTEPFRTNIEVGWGSLGFYLYTTANFAYEKCTARDAAQVVKLMRWVHIAESIPELGLADRDDLMPELREKARKCATFEIDFDSVTELPFNAPPYPMRSHVRAEGIRIQVTPDGASFEGGTGALNYLSYTHTADQAGCSTSTATEGGTFALREVRFNLNLSDLDYTASEIPDIAISFNPGRPTETITITCPGPAVVTIAPLFWHSTFGMLHLPELDRSNGAYTFRNWHFVGGELYAEKITERSMTGGEFTFHGTSFMVLVHTPQ